MPNEMDLPEGKTCSNCIHCRRCCAMFGAQPDNTSCDFYPVRFQEKTEPQLQSKV